MRRIFPIPLAVTLTLAGCQGLAPAGTGAPAGSQPNPATTAAAVGVAGKAVTSKTNPVVHDGGIVFTKAPTDGFRIAGRLPVGKAQLSLLAARRPLEVDDVRVRLVMANGRSVVTLPDDNGSFFFWVRPRGVAERAFGVVALRVERTCGSAETLAFATGDGHSQEWIKLKPDTNYDLGTIKEVDGAARAAVNLLAKLDTDGDGTPDATDTDDDGDGVPDSREQGAFVCDAGESHDNDHDGLGDRADTDDDNDGISDANDPDDDGDGLPDARDPDDNNDGYADTDQSIHYAGAANQRHDLDRDGTPDEADADDDGDGLPDVSDPDRDNDGVPNNQDVDDDNDGVRNTLEPRDSDGDGIVDFFDAAPGDTTDATLKGGWFDGIAVEKTVGDDLDYNFVGNALDPDLDGDGLPNAQDPDDDNDGFPDAVDADLGNDGFPDRLTGQGADKDGDAIPDGLDADADGDGQLDFLLDKAPWWRDEDGDGVPDEIDDQPAGPEPAEPMPTPTPELPGANGAELPTEPEV